MFRVIGSDKSYGTARESAAAHFGGREDLVLIPMLGMWFYAVTGQCCVVERV